MEESKPKYTKENLKHEAYEGREEKKCQLTYGHRGLWKPEE